MGVRAQVIEKTDWGERHVDCICKGASDVEAAGSDSGQPKNEGTGERRRQGADPQGSPAGT